MNEMDLGIIKKMSEVLRNNNELLHKYEIAYVASWNGFVAAIDYLNKEEREAVIGVYNETLEALNV